MASSSEATCYSCIKKEYYDFKWIISDYSLIFTKVIGIESPEFTVGSDSKNKFKLKLSNSTNSTVFDTRYSFNSQCLSLHVVEMDGEFLVKYNLSVIRDEKIVFIQTNYSKNKKGSITYMLNIETAEMKKFVSSADTITFHCELTVSTGSLINSMNDEVVKMDQVSTPTLKLDGAFDDKRYSDVVLRTACGKEIPAHRVLLAAASPVFNAMFSHNMLENKGKSVNMADVGYEAALELLRYIYKGTIGELEISSTIDLLVVADKYQLEGLKNKCEKILKLKLSSENAMDILQVADKCSMKSLKKNAVDFIQQHISVSSDSENVGNMILSINALNTS